MMKLHYFRGNQTDVSAQAKTLFFTVPLLSFRSWKLLCQRWGAGCWLRLDWKQVMQLSVQYAGSDHGTHFSTVDTLFVMRVPTLSKPVLSAEQLSRTARGRLFEPPVGQGVWILCLLPVPAILVRNPLLMYGIVSVLLFNTSIHCVRSYPSAFPEGFVLLRIVSYCFSFVKCLFNVHHVATATWRLPSRFVSFRFVKKSYHFLQRVSWSEHIYVLLWHWLSHTIFYDVVDTCWSGRSQRRAMCAR